MSQVTKNDFELYVPEYCNQGERIPFYILWSNSKKVQISIILPDGIMLDEAYNIDQKDLEIKKNEYTIKNFETEGYLGGVFSSKLYDQASVIKTMRFDILSDSNEQYSIEKPVELFRPDVEIDDSIETIRVKGDKNKRPVIDGKVKIFNHGNGTAIVRINILEESEIKEGAPEGFEEFKIKFLNELDDVFMETKKKFPQYENVIESARIASKNPLPSNKKELRKVRTTVEKLEQAFDNDEEFLVEFVHGLTSAYIKNVSIMTDADAFLAFLKSLGANKLLLLDTMKILKVSSTPQTLNAEIIITDLLQNSYPVKKLRPITIISDGNYSVPFYQILDSSKAN